MPRPDFENGLPRTILVREDLRADGKVSDALQTTYGNFAHAVLLEVKGIDPQTPEGIVTYGDNWTQLNVTRGPKSDSEHRAIGRVIKEIERNLPLGIAADLGGFSDSWPIMLRGRGDHIYGLLDEIQEGVRIDTVNARFLRKLAVLDLTANYPPFSRQELQDTSETPWGVKGTLPKTQTLIYHIRSGYRRQTPQEILGKPGDNLSASFHRFGPKKWL